MRKETIDGIFQHVHKLGGIEQTQILEYSPGHSLLLFPGNDETKNIHGSMHGGIIFTLCDIASAIATYSYEIVNVTQNGNIQYLKPVPLTPIYIEANTLCKTRHTTVNQVTIKDEAGNLFVNATFTMFLIAPLYPDNEI